MEILFFWVAFSIAVSLFASTRRNRDGAGWFVLAMIISPLLAGTFVAILKELPSKKNIQNYIENEMADGRMPVNVVRGSGTVTPRLSPDAPRKSLFGPLVFVLVALIFAFGIIILSHSTP